MTAPDPPSLRLASIHLFQHLTQDELEKVAGAARTRKIESGAFFFWEGDPAELIYVLLEGKVKLTQVTQEGQQIILRYVSPVEEFGVIAALSNTSYPVSAEAVNDSVCLTWDKRTMQGLMEGHPRIAINALEILARRVQEFQNRLREMATERVERRLARALLRLVRQSSKMTPEGVLIDLPLSRQDLAEMTGATLFTVSRILSQWESQELIMSGRERIVIRFPHGLVAIAEDLPPGKPLP